MLIFIFFIIFENRLILKYRIFYSNSRYNFIKQNNHRPTSVCDLKRYGTIMTSRQSYAFINLNRMHYVYINMGMQSKCKYKTINSQW